MIMNVTGVEKSKGEFLDKKTGNKVVYNNIKVHALKPISKKEDSDNFGSGYIPITVKFENDENLVKSIFGALPTKYDLLSMFGGDYDFYFDDKGIINRIVEPVQTVSKKGA